MAARVPWQICGLTLLWGVVWAIWFGAAAADEFGPAVADLSVEGHQISLELHLNAEAFLAGIDLDLAKTSESTVQDEDYDLLRALSPDEMDPMLRQFAAEWFEPLLSAGGQPLVLRLTDLTIPPVADPALTRTSNLILTGQLPDMAGAVSLTWPTGFGPLVLRQNGVQAPYSGFLNGGDRSPAIALNGGGAYAAKDVFLEAFPAGVTAVLTGRPDHALMVLALFFLSARFGILAWQVVVFLAGLSSALIWVQQGHGVAQSGIFVVPLAVTLVWAGAENIVSRRLHPWRLGMVLLFGALHGAVLALDFKSAPLPQPQQVAVLFGYGLGAAAGVVLMAGTAYLTLGYWFGRRAKYRGRVAMPASLIIALIGLYWLYVDLLA